MKTYTTAPMEDPRDAGEAFRRLEEIGYDGAFSFEAKLDPFLPLVLASQATSKLQLGTAIAIAFARNPMNLANLAYGMQSISGGASGWGWAPKCDPTSRNASACRGRGPRLACVRCCSRSARSSAPGRAQHHCASRASSIAIR